MSDDLGHIKFYLSANDRHDGRPLYEGIVALAHAQGLAGASVFRAELGFGHDRQVHDTLSEYTFADPPLTVEIVDKLDRLRALVGTFEPFADRALITLCPAVRGDLRGDSSDRTEQEISPVPLSEPARRVSIYIGSNDTWQGGNLAVAIVDHCRKLGVAGVTVTRGVMGFGKSLHIHRVQAFHLSRDLPEKVEVIDVAEKVDQLLLDLREMITEAVVLVEDVEVIRVVSSKPD